MDRLTNRISQDVPPRGPRVVLIEDDEPTRTALRGLLELGGYEVREEENGRDGVRAVREIVPDVVVTDILMPMLDGCAVARQLRSDDLTCHIPIVAATGQARPGDREVRLFAAVLRKPVSPSDLLNTVDRVRARQRTWNAGN
jgi:two-component system, cell cycle response regulator DivK